MTFDETLEAHALGGAYASREEADLGSIAVGKHADLVVLSRDPRGLSANDVEHLAVEQTIVGGRTTFLRVE